MNATCGWHAIASAGFRLTDISAGETVLLVAGGLLTLVALVVFVWAIRRSRHDR